jgi:hypothetical protein
VLDETWPILKGSAAFFAQERFFSSVAPFMQDKNGAVGEGFSTLAALIRLFSSVDMLGPWKV